MSGGFSGVVVLTGPQNGDTDERVPDAGPGACASSGAHRPRATGMLRRATPALCRDQESPDGAVRRLANLDQAGLRGLMRVIAAEHPHLHATQIDVDEDTDAEQVARQLLGGSDEDETAWRSGSGTRPGYAPPRCAPTSGEPPPSTTARRYAPGDPHSW